MKIFLTLMVGISMFVITVHARTYRQTSQIIANGAVDISNSSIRLHGTIGQPIIGNTEDSYSINEQGFWHSETASVNSIELMRVGTPVGFTLNQNYPNPFNPMTHINFSVPNDVHAVLRVFTLTGKLVKTLVDGELNAGNYDVGFNAGRMAAGAYFYTLEMSGQQITKQMTIIK